MSTQPSHPSTVGRNGCCSMLMEPSVLSRMVQRQSLGRSRRLWCCWYSGSPGWVMNNHLTNEIELVFVVAGHGGTASCLSWPKWLQSYLPMWYTTEKWSNLWYSWYLATEGWLGWVHVAYDTMIRISGSWSGVAEAFKIITEQYGWKHIVLASLPWLLEVTWPLNSQYSYGFFCKWFIYFACYVWFPISGPTFYLVAQ